MAETIDHINWVWPARLGWIHGGVTVICMNIVKDRYEIIAVSSVPLAGYARPLRFQKLKRIPIFLHNILSKHADH